LEANNPGKVGKIMGTLLNSFGGKTLGPFRGRRDPKGGSKGGIRG